MMAEKPNTLKPGINLFLERKPLKKIDPG